MYTVFKNHLIFKNKFIWIWIDSDFLMINIKLFDFLNKVLNISLSFITWFSWKWKHMSIIFATINKYHSIVSLSTAQKLNYYYCCYYSVAILEFKNLNNNRNASQIELLSTFGKVWKLFIIIVISCIGVRRSQSRRSSHLSWQLNTRYLFIYFHKFIFLNHINIYKS